MAPRAQPRKASLSHLGSSFPLIPRSHFDAVKYPPETFKNMWNIVGPTIAQNYAHHNLEDLCTIAFIEGIRMATTVITENPTLVGASGPNQAQTQTPNEPNKPRRLSI